MKIQDFFNEEQLNSEIQCGFDGNESLKSALERPLSKRDELDSVLAVSAQFERTDKYNYSDDGSEPQLDGERLIIRHLMIWTEKNILVKLTDIFSSDYIAVITKNPPDDAKVEVTDDRVKE